MNVERLREEVEFGLSNLNTVYDAIARFVSIDMDERAKTSAISYECIGYYNALEHLFIRFLKHIRGSVPSGQSSHRDILLAFEELLAIYKVECGSHTRDMIRNLMAFRHVATKIYGFLIDWGKLGIIVEEIQNHHRQVIQLIYELMLWMPLSTLLFQTLRPCVVYIASGTTDAVYCKHSVVEAGFACPTYVRLKPSVRMIVLTLAR